MDPKGAISKGLIGCRKCVDMGPPWVDFDEFTQDLLFLKMKKKFKDEFTKAWTHKVERSKRKVLNDGQKSAAAIQDAPKAATLQDGPTQDALPNTAADANEVPKVPAAGAKPEEKGAKSAPKPPNENQPPQQGQKRKPPPKELSQDAKKLKTLSGEINKLKVLYSKVLGDALQLLMLCGSDRKWSWAANPQNQGQLETALNEMKAAASDHTYSKVIVNTDAQLKKIYDEGQLIYMYEAMNATLPDKVSEVESICARMKGMASYEEEKEKTKKEKAKKDKK